MGLLVGGGWWYCLCPVAGCRAGCPRHSTGSSAAPCLPKPLAEAALAGQEPLPALPWAAGTRGAAGQRRSTCGWWEPSGCPQQELGKLPPHPDPKPPHSPPVTCGTRTKAFPGWGRTGQRAARASPITTRAAGEHAGHCRVLSSPSRRASGADGVRPWDGVCCGAARPSRGKGAGGSSGFSAAGVRAPPSEPSIPGHGTAACVRHRRHVRHRRGLAPSSGFV